MGGRQVPLETRTPGGSGSPLFFPLPQWLWGPRTLSLVLAGPWWELGFLPCWG